MLTSLLSGVILLIFTVLLPLLTGTVLFIESLGLVETFVCGLLAMAGLFEVCCVPLVLLHRPLHEAILLWLGVWMLLLLAALTKRKRRGRALKPLQQSRLPGEKWEPLTVLLLACVVVLLLLQCGAYLYGTHIDNDDARYVANAVAAYETDTMYRLHPNTGEEMTYYVGEISKEVVSALMMYDAAISRLVRMHPTILMHSFWPVFWLLVSYGIYWMIARRLYRERRQRLIFLLVCMLVTVMGGQTIYTGTTFTLTRLWQGKALIPSVVVPFAFWLMVSRQELSGQAWGGCLLLMNVFACLCSGNGVYLSALLTGVVSLAVALRERRLRPVLLGLACCVPNGICTGIYLMAKKLILR